MPIAMPVLLWLQLMSIPISTPSNSAELLRAQLFVYRNLFSYPPVSLGGFSKLAEAAKVEPSLGRTSYNYRRAENFTGDIANTVRCTKRIGPKHRQQSRKFNDGI
jgi:hypothetical protein